MVDTVHSTPLRAGITTTHDVKKKNVRITESAMRMTLGGPMKKVGRAHKLVK